MPVPMQRAGEGDPHPAHRRGTKSATTSGIIPSHCYFLKLYMHLHIPIVLRYRMQLSWYRHLVPQDGCVAATYYNGDGAVCGQILSTLASSSQEIYA